ncbi:MAG: hypothetical protein M0P73_10665 [Syntrophobacterales bacterium]|jgi:hypothetical protein|nr:hypothetical protein [Syntrophobacterales bacterium]
MNDLVHLRELLKDCLELMECEVDKCPFNGYRRDEWDKPGRRCICSHNCYERTAAMVARLRAALESEICPPLEIPDENPIPLGR